MCVCECVREYFRSREMYSPMRRNKTVKRKQQYTSAVDKKKIIFFGCKKRDRQKKKETKKRTGKELIYKNVTNEYLH